MAKEKVLALLAVVGLLLGGGSLGFIIYDNFFAPADQEQQIQEFWADYDGNLYYCLANPASYRNFTYTYISFTLVRNASVHFIYTGDAYIDDSSGQSYMYLWWRFDGSILPWGYAHVRGNGTAGFWHIPTCMQMTLELTPGSYSMTLSLQGDSTANHMGQNYLTLAAYYS